MSVSDVQRRGRSRAISPEAVPRRVNPYVLTRADLTKVVRQARALGAESARELFFARAEIERLRLEKRIAAVAARREFWWFHVSYGTLVSLLTFAWIRERFFK